LLKREFTVADEYHFQRSSPVRWIISHLMRYTHLIIAYVLACIFANILYTAIPIMTGIAFDGVLQRDQSKLLLISLILLALVVLGGTSDLGARFFPELLGKRFARDATVRFARDSGDGMMPPRVQRKAFRLAQWFLQKQGTGRWPRRPRA